MSTHAADSFLDVLSSKSYVVDHAVQAKASNRLLTYLLRNQFPDPPLHAATEQPIALEQALPPSAKAAGEGLEGGRAVVNARQVLHMAPSTNSRHIGSSLHLPRLEDGDRGKLEDGDHEELEDGDHEELEDGDHGKLEDGDHGKLGDGDHGKLEDGDHDANNDRSAA
eukprot:1152181-Pelagomonas_calceolata.AAC.1